MNRVTRAITALIVAGLASFAGTLPANAASASACVALRWAPYQANFGMSYVNQSDGGTRVDSVVWTLRSNSGPGAQSNVHWEIHGRRADGSVARLVHYTSPDNVRPGYSQVNVGRVISRDFVQIRLFGEATFDRPNDLDPTCSTTTPWV